MSCLALIKRHPTICGAGSEVQSPRKPSQHTAGKRKAKELPSCDGPTVPATRRPAPDPLVRPATLGTLANGLLGAAGSPIPPRVGQRMPWWLPDLPTHNGQMGRPSPKPMVRTLPNLQPPLSQPSDACLAKSCPGLWAACQLATTLPMSFQQENDIIKHMFLCQESLIHVTSSHG